MAGNPDGFSEEIRGIGNGCVESICYMDLCSVCVCVCVCECICIGIGIGIYICICIYIYMYMYVCMYVVYRVYSIL